MPKSNSNTKTTNTYTHFNEIEEKFSPVSMLVNNAGIPAVLPAEHSSLEDNYRPPKPENEEP